MLIPIGANTIAAAGGANHTRLNTSATQHQWKIPVLNLVPSPGSVVTNVVSNNYL